jgi:hypothetical protein
VFSERRPFEGPSGLDDLLKKARGILGTHWRYNFVFAKWRPKIFTQPSSFEISPGDGFGFKHGDIENVTEAAR